MLDGYRITRPTDVDCPVKFYDVMTSCWEIDPDRRPTFERLARLMDDFFVEIEAPYADNDE